MNRHVALVGASGVGKTTQMLRLIAEFHRRGLSITVIKHSHHRIEDLEKSGSDSERYRRSGAEAVALLSRDGMLWWSQKTAPAQISLDRLEIGGIVLVEGGKSSSLPKIEILDGERGFAKLLVEPANLIAVLGAPTQPGLTTLNPQDPSRTVDFLFDYWRGPKLSR